jgi:hypothetical protein
LAIDRQVNIDGTIWVPYLGSVHVLGKTEAELGLVRKLFAATALRLRCQDHGPDPRRAWSGKAFFVIGEAVQRGRIQMTRGDLTIFDVLMMVGTTNLANTGRIHLIKPDAENPLDVVINFREMATSGLMKYNMPIYENDIIYVPPTFFGMLARFLERPARAADDGRQRAVPVHEPAGDLRVRDHRHRHAGVLQRRLPLLSMDLPTRCSRQAARDTAGGHSDGQ